MFQLALLGLLGLTGRAYGHGYVATFTVNGEAFEGFRRFDAPAIPNSISWSFSTPDEGGVLDPSLPSMACRHDGKPAANAAPIAAGQTVDFDWTSADTVRNPDGWAEGHRGPVITYLAPCNGDCATIEPTSLRWTKIAEAGLISGPATREGVWATDLLRQGNNSAMIPTSIAPGQYVIRNELIALHRANEKEPEFYMACANIEVTDGGEDDLSDTGVLATELYSQNDASLFDFSIYENNGPSWEIPGPPLYQASSPGKKPQTGGDGSNSSPDSSPAPAPAPAPNPSAPSPSADPAVGPCGRAWTA